MKSLLLISDTREHAAVKARRLSDLFAVHAVGVDEVAPLTAHAPVLVDLDLDGGFHADALRAWLQRRPPNTAAIFAVDKGSRVQVVRAYSIGATDLIARPFDAQAVAGKLAQPHGAAGSILQCDGVGAGITALQNLFSHASSGTPLKAGLLTEAADKLIEHIDAFGIADWMRTVRVHHSRTYQHCLLVCGAAAAFGQALGFNYEDRRRVALAGLVHDVGKARVPVMILEKPGKLDAQEWTEVQRHAVYGYEALKDVDSLHPEMVDVVRHHHEYLDGTGYPDGLRGADIAELTRVVTVIDVFAALIEPRAYRPAMSGPTAYQVLVDMGPKLDQALVRAFELLSLAEFE